MDKLVNLWFYEPFYYHSFTLWYRWVTEKGQDMFSTDFCTLHVILERSMVDVASHHGLQTGLQCKSVWKVRGTPCSLLENRMCESNFELRVTKRSFNNYVDRILQFFAPPPPPAWTVFTPCPWTKSDIFWPPPSSSCPRSYWMAPWPLKNVRDKIACLPFTQLDQFLKWGTYWA